MGDCCRPQLLSHGFSDPCRGGHLRGVGCCAQDLPAGRQRIGFGRQIFGNKCEGFRLNPEQRWRIAIGARDIEQEFVRFLKEYPDSLTDEFYLPAAVDSWISGNLAKVSVRSASCKWMGVTYRDDKPAVIEALSKLVEDGHYPTPLFASNLSTA